MYLILTLAPFFFCSLKAELAEIQERSRLSGGRYVQNQQLEDLRNEVEKFTKEKKAWFQEREDAEKEMEAKKKNLMKTQVIFHKYNQ